MTARRGFRCRNLVRSTACKLASQSHCVLNAHSENTAFKPCGLVVLEETLICLFKHSRPGAALCIFTLPWTGGLPPTLSDTRLKTGSRSLLHYLINQTKKSQSWSDVEAKFRATRDVEAKFWATPSTADTSMHGCPCLHSPAPNAPPASQGNLLSCRWHLIDAQTLSHCSMCRWREM